MKKLLLSFLFFALTAPLVQAADDCIAQADEAKLTYLARDSFIKKCQMDQAEGECNALANDPPGGERLRGDERETFMRRCKSAMLTGRPVPAGAIQSDTNQN